MAADPCDAFSRELAQHLPAGCLTQVHGPSAAGKTSLALQLARHWHPAALILPEQPVAQRLEGLVGEVKGRVIVARPNDLEAQSEAVGKAAELLATGRLELVVLDSLTYLYRFEQMASTEALREILRQAHRLRAAAREGRGRVVVTNQVRGGPRGPRPLGGPAVAHLSDVIVGVDELDGPWRRVRLTKHPCQAPEQAWDVRVGDNGLG